MRLSQVSHIRCTRLKIVTHHCTVFRSLRSRDVSDYDLRKRMANGFQTAVFQQYWWWWEGGRTHINCRPEIYSKSKRCATQEPYTSARGKRDKFVCPHRTCR